MANRMKKADLKALWQSGPEWTTFTDSESTAKAGDFLTYEGRPAVVLRRIYGAVTVIFLQTEEV